MNLNLNESYQWIISILETSTRYLRLHAEMTVLIAATEWRNACPTELGTHCMVDLAALEVYIVWMPVSLWSSVTQV